MPTVPKYNVGGSVQPEAMPQVRVTPNAPLEAFGGGQGLQEVNQASNSLTSHVAGIAEQEKKKADDSVAQDSYKSLVELKNNLLYSTDPNSPGALSKKGKDAFGVIDTYGQQFDDAAAKIEENLANEDQRQMVKRIRIQQRDELDTTLHKHMFAESVKLEDETSKNAIEAARQDAVMNYSEPGKVDDSIRLQKAMIADHAGKVGLPGEYIEVETKKAESATHSGVINQMLANRQDLAAKKYYDQIDGKSVLTPDDNRQVSAALRTGTVRGESQRSAGDIMNKFGSDEKSALAEARKITDPDIQHATVDEIKTRFEENAKIKRDGDEQLSRSVLSGIKASQVLPPPDVWNTMQPEQQKAFMQYYQMTRAGVEPKTDLSTYYRLERMAGEDKPDFLKENLYLYAPYLAKGDLDRLQSLQKDARSGSDKELDGISTKQQVIDQTLRANGIDPTPKQGSKDATVDAEFRRRVDEEFIQRTQEKKRPLNNKEMRDIVDSMMLESSSGGFWDSLLAGRFSSTKKGFQVKYNDIPTAEKQKIEDALNANGRAASHDEVVRLFLRGQLRKKQNADAQ